jgi:hypothetical protein
VSSDSRSVVSGARRTSPGPIPAVEQGDLDDFVPVSLRRHRHELPADLFDPLVLVHHPGGDDRLDFGDAEAPARQAFCGAGDPGGGGDIHHRTLRGRPIRLRFDHIAGLAPRQRVKSAVTLTAGRDCARDGNA